VTPATIKHISFSTDSKLIAVTSTPKGTNHIYGINPQGGVVDAISHLDINNQERNVLYQYGSSGETPLHRGKITSPEAQQPPKLAVIRASTVSNSGQEQSNDDLDKLFGSAVYFDNRTSKDYIMFIFESNGTLNHHRIALGKSETNPLVLAGNVQGVVEWDLRRVTKGRPYNFKMSNHHKGVPNNLESDLKNNHSVWLSNIEIDTCTMAHTPFWLADDLFPLQAYVSLPQIDDISNLSDPLYQDRVYQNTELVVISTYDPTQKRSGVRDILLPEEQRQPQPLQALVQPPQQLQSQEAQAHSPDLQGPFQIAQLPVLPLLPVPTPAIVPVQAIQNAQLPHPQHPQQDLFVYPPNEEGDLSVSTLMRNILQ